MRYMNRRVRVQRKRGDALYESTEDEDIHRWFAWHGTQRWIWSVGKWMGDVVVVAEGNRFRHEMARVKRGDWRGRWERDASLLGFV